MSAIDRPFPKGKNKKVIRLIKDRLGGKIITKLLVKIKSKTHKKLSCSA